MIFPYPALFRRLLPPLILGLISALCVLPAHAQDDDLPANLGRELHPLAQWRATQSAAQDARGRQSALAAHLDRNRERIQTDGSGNVIVNVRLDGTMPAAEVKRNLAALGLTLTSEHVARHADGRDGVVTAHLPLEKAAAAAKTPGVLSVLVARRPHVRAGKVTSAGVAVLHADTVQNSGYTGAGISVGILSDSFNVATAESVAAADAVSTNVAQYAPVTDAAMDVASGDLPASGVTVLKDDPDPVGDAATDEGRAMLQIVHDVAPDAALAFCYAGGSQSEFADNIKALRTNSKTLCNVIVDDITYYDEPFFSDGPAAQAVDEVVTSNALAGTPVIYYSAAGNEGDLSYAADFNPVTNAAGRAKPEGVHLEQVPTSLTAGGFHNFKKADVGHGTKFVQTVTVSGADAIINFQWDDPYGSPSTDYNLLVFDADGNYHSGSNANDAVASGIDNNFHTGEPSEIAYLPLNADGSDTTYKLVISKTATAGTATHLRYIVEEGDTVTGKYLHTAQPTLYGHPAAANADGVAAYDVHDITIPEGYESFGPVTIYFDDAGNRLATPVVRQQPTIATVDGVNTTFFPEGPISDQDSDSDGYPNFYGTSAAGPHAAGVAALLLQAAGGKSSLTAAAMRSLLESTASSHDLDAATSVADFSSADGLFHVTLTARGDASNNSAFDAKFFTLTFTGPAGSSLHKALIDIGKVGEDFDPSTTLGSPFTIGQATGIDTTRLVDRLSTDSDGVAKGTLLVKIPAGGFPSGGTLAFGIDRDNAKAGSGGNDADILAGSTITAKFILADGTGDKAVGTLANKTGTGYSPDVGYGLINAQAALNKLLGK